MADYDEGVTRKPDVYKYGEDFSRFIKRYEDFIKIAKLGENLHLVLLSLVDDQTYDILCKVQISDRISSFNGYGCYWKAVQGGYGGGGGGGVRRMSIYGEANFWI